MILLQHAKYENIGLIPVSVSEEIMILLQHAKYENIGLIPVSFPRFCKGGLGKIIRPHEIRLYGA